MTITLCQVKAKEFAVKRTHLQPKLQMVQGHAVQKRYVTLKGLDYYVDNVTPLLCERF